MRSLALFSIMLLISPVVRAQQQPGALTIVVLKGEGGRNSIKSRTGTPIEVEVRDPQGKPIAGAQVIFQLPSFGASGSFPGGQLVQRTTTGPSGQAVMTGFVPNDIEGRFNIKVTADSGTLSGSAVVSETNVAMLAADQPKSKKGLWILIAVAGGGAAAAAVALGGGGGGSSPPPAPIPPSVTITPGTISVGGPR